ncbi:MAG: hypothetical protein WBQ43_05135 [Terriglobales bacterium]
MEHFGWSWCPDYTLRTRGKRRVKFLGMTLTGCIVCGLILVSWIVFQELSWRSRFKESKAEWDERSRTDVDRAFAHGMAHGGSTVASHTFRHRDEKKGLFTRKSRELYLTVTFFDGKVKLLSGDIAYLEKFEIPEEIMKAIKAAGLTLKP